MKKWQAEARCDSITLVKEANLLLVSGDPVAAYHKLGKARDAIVRRMLEEFGKLEQMAQLLREHADDSVVEARPRGER